MTRIINALRDYYFLLIVLTITVILRLWNLSWGLPEIYEEATPFFKAWGFWNWGTPGMDFNPHFFNYPALTFYLQFIAQMVHFGVGYLLEWYPTIFSFEMAFRSDPTIFIIIARIISVLFDAGTVVLIYRLSKGIGDPYLEKIAPLLAAINILLIQQAHIINVDTPLTFSVMLAFVALRRVLIKPTVGNYITVGIIIGVAASLKYTGAMLLIVLTSLHLLSNKTPTRIIRALVDRRLFQALAASAITFLLINPFILLDYSAFLEDFGFEQNHMSVGHLGVRPDESSPTFYLSRILPQNLGLVFLLITVIAIVRIIRRKDLFLNSMIFFILLYIIVISSWAMRADRYILPVIPLLVLVGSIGIIDLANLTSLKIQSFLKSGSSTRTFFPIICSLSIVGIPIYFQFNAVKTYQESFGLPDTRTIIKDWINTNLPDKSVIATPPYGIEIPSSRYFEFTIPFLPVYPERVSAFYDTRWYEDMDLIIASDYDYGRYRLEPARYSTMLNYYKTLEQSWTKVFEVVPSEGQQGPLVSLYSYPESLKRSSFDQDLFKLLGGVPESSRVSNFLKMMGFTLQQKGKLAKAEQVLAELLSVETHNLEVRKSHAALLYDLARLPEALSEIHICLMSDSNRSDLLTLQGLTLLRLSRLSEAEISFIRAIELNPENPTVYDQLLAIYVHRRDKERALDILKRYLKIVPPGSDKAQTLSKDIQTLTNMH